MNEYTKENTKKTLNEKFTVKDEMIEPSGIEH